MTHTMTIRDVEQVVFAGGGNRCFWQAGFWQTVAGPLNLQPKTIVSVSAGSAISCAILANKIDDTLRITKRETRGITRNREFKNLFRREPVFPHERVYRGIIAEAMGHDGLPTLLNGPRNRIQIARIPKWLGPRSATLVGLTAYQLEKTLREPMHPTFGRKLGFESEFIDAQSCQSTEALANLIIASSCTPPFTSLAYHDNSPALDGGLVDNVPVHGVPDTKANTLILLTRPYKTLPNSQNRWYIQPSRPVPVDSWDYTNPQGIQDTYDLGRRDGEEFLRAFGAMPVQR